MKLSEQQTAEGILFTDQYQLTMAQLYYRMGLHEKEAQFDHFFRSYPDYGNHRAGYCINAGLDWFLDWLEQVHVRDKDIEYLRSQEGRAGEPLFGDDFLQWLRKSAPTPFEAITMQAVPEGRVVHANTPLTVVHGPLAIAQILETPLLNQLNYQILMATKAARMREVAGDQLLLEFGARRGHDRGANAGARAALIGGADFSSNTGISYVLGYPPKGTHAHSMVQAFIGLGMGELEAFRAYAEVYPDDCLLLVDTVDTLESGLPNAIRVFEELRRAGHKPVGVRLDSGDLAYLAVQAAKMLDDAGFSETTIVLSNELDEITIWQILTQIRQEAGRYEVDADRLIKRLSYGVGTRLITSEGDPALGGVYKLTAVRDEGEWRPAIKISESAAKTPNPGQKRLWRLYDRRGHATVDLISLEDESPAEMEQIRLHHPSDQSKQRCLRPSDIQESEPLLVEVLKEGRLVDDLPSIEAIREQRRCDMERLDTGVKRIMNPHIYHVSLSERLWALKHQLIESMTNVGKEEK